MLEKFEQHFAQIKEKEEKPKEVSPKLYQRAIEYAKRIKEIRKKETPTEEDLKEVKRLLKKIERIFLPEELYFESKRAEQLLESLKNTPLYDKERKQWNEYMNERKQFEYSDSSRRRSSDQLLGVIAEAVIGNIDEAQQLLKSLKNTPLYDKERKQWNWYMNKEQQLPDSSRSSSDQLLGVIAEAVIGNISQAQQLLESLKNTPLYDKERKQWNECMNKEQRLPDSANSIRYSLNQLLGVIVEAFDEKPEEFVRWFTKS
jgi:hypothetical protein